MSAPYVLAFPTDRLFAHALRILDDAAEQYGRPFDWTFGGGTALALRHDHRYSKDVELFVPDPRYLGYLTPRLSDAAALEDPDCEAAAEFVKLRYREGEIDFVVGRCLTEPGAQTAQVNGHPVRLETDVEIVAKKLFFRGDRFKPRDVFDLALLLDIDPGAASLLAAWTQRHGAALRSQLQTNTETMQLGFEAIDARSYRPSFAHALESIRRFLIVSA